MLRFRRALTDKLSPPKSETALARLRPLTRMAWLWLLPLVLLFMHRWLNGALPLSPRGENMPEVSYLWQLRRLWQEGQALSGWNPALLGGIPTAVSRTYHLHVLLAGLSLALDIPPEQVFKLVQVAATWLTGLGMYLYARQMGRSPGASLVAAAILALFPVRVLLTVESVFVTLFWAGLPWAFWAYERSRHAPAPTTRPALVLGLVFAWLALTGTQLALLLPIPLLTYVLLREALDWHAGGGGRAIRPRLGHLCAIGGIAGGAAGLLALFYFLPLMLEKDWLSVARYTSASTTVSRWPVSPSLLLEILVNRWLPGFEAMGWDLARIVPNISWYLGLAALLLACLGITSRRWSESLPLIALFVLGLLLAASWSIPHNPAYILLHRLPLLADTTRNPFRYLWVVSFALAGLAALGVDGLMGRLPKSLPGWLLPTVALCLVILDFWPATQAHSTVDAYFPADVAQTYALLEQMPDGERYWAPFQMDRPGWHYVDTSYGVRYTDRPSVNDNAYHSTCAPDRASLFYTDTLQGQIEQGQLSAEAQHILDLSHVRYALVRISPSSYGQAVEQLAQKDNWQLLHRTEHAALLENLSARPYVQIYGAGLPYRGTTEEELFQQLVAAVERNYALVEQPDSPGDREGDDSLLMGQAAAGETLPAIATPHIQWSLERPRTTEIALHVQGDAPFLLMLSETWYPLWRVQVNGEEQPLLRLNGNFLGVLVADSDSEVRFRYRHPWYVWLGYLTSALGAIAIAAVLLWRRCPGPKVR